jgi:hypothetical protein
VGWLKESGMFNEEGLINDGLDKDCFVSPVRESADAGIIVQ